ncbi:energy-coupling factor transporter transmembrane component T family protein [Clostridium oryzae]|uniref:Nickel transport protein NikQ n=1 Tax=Clostridium oryzae TaxID=1450648 RepID=A0A1V4ICZ0_9CLOT|nr:energy-coupling factor transporter transmembrane component T [Clostridium oryzae]OPJ57799.1 nickel transport protein NikQ [Clostridium oryzae]
MPEWLLKEDEYTPAKSRDGFINKSILSLMGSIDKFRRQTEYKDNSITANALTKLLSVLILIIFVSLSKSFAFVLIANVMMLIVINFLSTNEIKQVLKISFTVAGFTMIVLLPSVFIGFSSNAFMITLKVFVSVVFVNSLASSTQWNDIIRALKVFKLPDMFIFVLDITIKYIMVLGEFSLNMVYALKLRSVGRSRSKNTALSGIIGTMFIKSKDMAQEMQEAMECRGFTGEYRAYKRFKFGVIDYCYIIFDILFAITFFYFDRV